MKSTTPSKLTIAALWIACIAIVVGVISMLPVVDYPIQTDPLSMSQMF